MSLPRLLWRPGKAESAGIGPRNLMVHHLPQVFLLTPGDGKSLDQMMGKSLQKMSLKNTSIFFFFYLNHEILSIWANEWMTELPPFKMGWKLYRHELWQVPSFMDHMLFFFPPIGDASKKFFSISVCSPLSLLNILKSLAALDYADLYEPQGGQWELPSRLRAAVWQ